MAVDKTSKTMKGGEPLPHVTEPEIKKIGEDLMGGLKIDGKKGTLTVKDPKKSKLPTDLI